MKITEELKIQFSKANWRKVLTMEREDLWLGPFFRGSDVCWCSLTGKGSGRYSQQVYSHPYHTFPGRLSTDHFHALISTLDILDGAVRHNVHVCLGNLVAKFIEHLEMDNPYELPRKRCTSRLWCYSTSYSPTHPPAGSFYLRAYFKSVKRLKKRLD